MRAYARASSSSLQLGAERLCHGEHRRTAASLGSSIALLRTLLSSDSTSSSSVADVIWLLRISCTCTEHSAGTQLSNWNVPAELVDQLLGLLTSRPTGAPYALPQQMSNICCLEARMLQERRSTLLSSFCVLAILHSRSPQGLRPA